MHVVTRSLRLLAAAVVACVSAAMPAHATTAVQSVLYTFAGGQPSQLIQASDGNLYGTSSTGGANAKGFVFALTTGGAESVLYSFTGAADGGTPKASLIEGNDGNLYGTNTTGGSGSGVLFQLTLSGSLTVLHTFAAADGQSAGALIQNNAGDFFGAAQTGGSNFGTVFEYTHTGSFLVLHTFTESAGDGGQPNSQLLQASDGFIYGSTLRGGSNGNGGSLFRFDPTNLATFTTFASFPPTNQGDPFYDLTFGMTEGPDGVLYGLTEYGGTGPSGYGTVYKVVPGATPLFTINAFSLNGGTQGGLPQAGLTLGGDGNFYSTTTAYGTGGPPNGTIFQFIPSGGGSLTTLYGFNSPAGDATGGPIAASDGNFYGPTGAQIYKLVLTPAVPPPVTLTASATSIQLGASVTLDWQVDNAFSQTAENCYAHGGASASWSGSQALTGSVQVTPAAIGVYNYALTCGGVESAIATVTVTPSANQTATPVINPNGGNFTGPVAYKITDATPGAIIHYTTNGTTPTATSPVWGGIPVVLTSSATIQAIAVASPLTASSVASATFVLRINARQTCTVNHVDGFGSATDLKLNHGAVTAGTLLELTHGLANESTSAFTIKRIPVGTFVTAFRFRFYQATPTSADGLTFTMQANADNVFGADGAGLGYAGIPHSMALKFDLHNNAGEGANSVGLYFGGTVPTVPAVNLSNINLHSGHILEAYITYDGLYLTLDLMDTVTLAHFKHNFKLPATNPFGATSAFAGFTASTGSFTSNAQILAWALESNGACVSALR